MLHHVCTTAMDDKQTNKTSHMVRQQCQVSWSACQYINALVRTRLSIHGISYAYSKREIVNDTMYICYNYDLCVTTCKNMNSQIAIKLIMHVSEYDTQ